jgi:hypothetical protein
MGPTTGCSVLHLRQPLRAINLLDEFLAKKVKDNSKLGPVGSLGRTVTLSTLDAQTHDDLSAVIWGRAADASHGIARALLLSAAHRERAWWAAITDMTRQCYALSRFGSTSELA